ncbi:MAG: glycosyltransferase family 2 protein [Patescibacteria group bacterium]
MRSDENYWRDKNWYYHNDIDRLINFLIPDGSKKKEFSDTSLTQLATPTSELFEYIVLNNVISSLGDIQETLVALRKNIEDSGRLVLVFHNYLWEPVFNILEFLGLKHKPIRQNWLSVPDIENFLLLSGYEVVKSGRRMLFPAYIPIFSGIVNSLIAELPFISRLCVTQFVVARPMVKSIRDYGVTVVVPARNEKGNIESLVKRTPIFPAGTEIIFVEGHSKDDTWEEILRVAGKYGEERKIVVTKQDGVGKGDAVRKGFEMAKGGLLMILDADMTVAPEDLSKFYDAIKNGRGDFINGSRMIYPMEKQAMRFLNTIANKFFASAFSWILSQRIKDTLCGTKVLLKRDYDKIVANRSFFGNFDPFGDFDLIFGAAKLNMKIIDLPIRYRDRTYGTTQISRFRHGWLLLKMTVFAMKKFKFN